MKINLFLHDVTRDIITKVSFQYSCSTYNLAAGDEPSKLVISLYRRLLRVSTHIAHTWIGEMGTYEVRKSA
jgi:hypothetical protein